jgi:hypothetical protein
MTIERSDIQFPIWRKKVDGSILTDHVTPIPSFACKMWNIEQIFKNATLKTNMNSKVQIKFKKQLYGGNVTLQKRKNTPLFRLFINEELSFLIKETFLMSYMRDIEKKLHKDNSVDIEKEIPFWEFLDIEFDEQNKIFLFNAHYKQKPSFPELFKRIIGSATLKRIDNESTKKNNIKIYKQDWKPREEYFSELGAQNVIYMLIDTKNKHLYVGETKNLIQRFSQGHTSINKWDYYRFDVLPDSLKEYRVEIERMQIRTFASLLKNSKNITSKNISDYILVNNKIDK